MAKRKAKQSPFERALGGMRDWGWTVLALGIGVLAVVAYSDREGSAIQQIRPVVLPPATGENLVTVEEILELIADGYTQPLDQLTLSDIDIEYVEQIVEGQPFVADAEAYVNAELTLNVIVTQRTPLLRIIADNGQNYYLDEWGARMPLSENYTVRVPVVTGALLPWDNNYREDPDHQLSGIVTLARWLREDDFLSAMVEQIHLTEDGELRLAPKVGDQVIELGRYDRQNTYDRLNRLKIFYREGLPYEGWRKYRSFDLRYAKQVVAKKN